MPISALIALPALYIVISCIVFAVGEEGMDETDRMGWGMACAFWPIIITVYLSYLLWTRAVVHAWRFWWKGIYLIADKIKEAMK